MRPGEPEEVVALRDFPPPAGEGFPPLVAADDLRAALAYPAADGAAVVFFPRCEATRSRRRGGAERGAFEVLRSSWLRDVGPAEAEEAAALRHLVFALADLQVEVAVPRWDVRDAVATRAEAFVEVEALLRRDGAEVVRLVDTARGRELPTALHLPARTPAPLVVFGHGWFGHPRKFTRLFRAWRDAGIAVAAPAFPRTNDEAPVRLDFDDVVNQPADVSFVLDELLADGRFDSARVGVAGFSLGAMTALAAARDGRVRAVACFAGRLSTELDARLEAPLLVVHGDRDASVPYAEGRRVYEAASGPKVFLTFPACAHDVCEDWSPVLDDVLEPTTAFWRLYLLGDDGARQELLRAPAGARVESAGVA